MINKLTQFRNASLHIWALQPELRNSSYCSSSCSFVGNPMLGDDAMRRSWRVVSEYNVLVGQFCSPAGRTIKIRLQIIRRRAMIRAEISRNDDQIDLYVVIASRMSTARPDLVARCNVLSKRPHVAGVFDFG